MCMWKHKGTTKAERHRGMWKHNGTEAHTRDRGKDSPTARTYGRACFTMAAAPDGPSTAHTQTCSHVSGSAVWLSVLRAGRWLGPAAATHSSSPAHVLCLHPPFQTTLMTPSINCCTCSGWVPPSRLHSSRFSSRYCCMLRSLRRCWVDAAGACLLLHLWMLL